MDWNQIGQQIAHDMANREARVRELGREEARLKMVLDELAHEVEQAKAERIRIKTECETDCNKAHAHAHQAQAELAIIEAKVKAQKAALDTEKDVHKEAVVKLKAEHARLIREHQAELAAIENRKAQMLAEHDAFLAKWSK
jgi:hypothetical protein